MKFLENVYKTDHNKIAINICIYYSLSSHCSVRWGGKAPVILLRFGFLGGLYRVKNTLVFNQHPCCFVHFSLTKCFTYTNCIILYTYTKCWAGQSDRILKLSLHHILLWLSETCMEIGTPQDIERWVVCHSICLRCVMPGDGELLLGWQDRQYMHNILICSI